MSFEQPIALVGELTVDDARQGMRLAQASIWTKLVRASSILIVLGCLLFLWSIVFSTGDQDWSSSDCVLIAVCVLVPIVLIVRYALGRDQLHRAWEQKVGIFQRASTIINADGVTIQLAYAQTAIGWKHFTDFRRTENVVVLFTSGSWMLFGRSRFGSDTEWERFVSFVEATYRYRL
jgi:hypothetical protein